MENMLLEDTCIGKSKDELTQLFSPSLIWGGILREIEKNTLERKKVHSVIGGNTAH